MNVCPSCSEAELAGEDHDLRCPLCGWRGDGDYLRRLEARARDRQIKADVLACLREDQAKGSGQGGSRSSRRNRDDKLSFRRLSRSYDDSILSVTPVRLESRIVRVRGIEVTAEEARTALAEILEEET